MRSSDLGRRLETVMRRIADAARACDRDPAGVRLVAVSKTHPASAIRDAYEAGQRDFGENYVQELAAKAAELRDLDGIRWHFVGHLQTNKAKLLAPFCHTVHGIDSERLAAELGKRAVAAGRIVDALVQVNVAGEVQKSGCNPDEAGAVCEAIAAEPGLRLRGLMVMPPWDLSAEAARPYFTALRELRDRLGGAARLPELSMGMSHDFEVAIAEGATMVRIGTAIFGER